MLMAKSKEDLKSLLMKVKEDSEKASLRLSLQKMKIMTSGPITSWQIIGEKMETVTDFILLSSKITVNGNYSHEIEMPAPWKKNYDKPRQHIKRQSHHFVNKGPYSQSGCESWTIKKAESQRIDASELWCWRRLLRVP